MLLRIKLLCSLSSALVSKSSLRCQQPHIMSRRASRREKKTQRSSSSSGFGSLTEVQIEEFKEAFDMIDKDGDGKISIKDLESAFKSFGKSADKSELQEMLKDGDDDKLNFPTFLGLFAERLRTADPEELLTSSFETFDEAATGVIDVEEMRSILKLGPTALTDAQIEDFLHDAPIKKKAFDYNKFMEMAKGGEK